MLDRCEIIRGDITAQRVDAIVNAANSSLLGGGGVDGAIHRGAGPGLVEECRMLGGCRTGEAKITGGHHLPAAWVLHTVGPVWHGGDHGEPELLASCYRNCFRIAEERGILTMAFPSISTGNFGYPVGEASRIALREIARGLAARSALELVRVVCFEDRVHAAYQAALAAFEG